MGQADWVQATKTGAGGRMNECSLTHMPPQQAASIEIPILEIVERVVRCRAAV